MPDHAVHRATRSGSRSIRTRRRVPDEAAVRCALHQSPSRRALNLTLEERKALAEATIEASNGPNHADWRRGALFGGDHGARRVFASHALEIGEVRQPEIKQLGRLVRLDRDAVAL